MEKDRGESTKASSQWRKIAQAWACGKAQPQKKGKGCQCLIRKTDGGLSSNRSERDRLLLFFPSLRFPSIFDHRVHAGEAVNQEEDGQGEEHQREQKVFTSSLTGRQRGWEITNLPYFHPCLFFHLFSERTKQRDRRRRAAARGGKRRQWRWGNFIITEVGGMASFLLSS